MKQMITREFFAYWRRVKGARSAPERNDIDLAEIRHLLAYAFMVRMDLPRRFPLKMCGTRLNAYWLEEQNGKSFLDLWRESDRDMAMSALHTVVDAAKPVVAGATSGAPESPALDLELLLLPLRHWGKTHSLLLGSLAPAFQPHWLGRVSVRALNFNSMRVIGIDDAHPPHHPMRCAQTTRPPRERAAGRPPLVVYDGGKSARLNVCRDARQTT